MAIHFKSTFAQKPQTIFWLFIIFHTLAWTIGPMLTRHTLPHDTLEDITWGLQWQWGYHKHPFLTAWLTAGIVQALHAVEWPIYLLAQLAVSTTLIAVWRLGREMLPPIEAVIAALCLDGVLFYNINSFNLTPDTLQSPIWALLALFFYKALTTQAVRFWLLTGLLAALAIMTKYQVALLLLPMALLCLSNRTARDSFKHCGIYIAFFCMLALITPHLIWLVQHDWITLHYARNIGESYTRAPSHFLNPLNFALSSLAYVAGAFLLCWPFYCKHNNSLATPLHGSSRRTELRNLTPFQWQFLLWMGLGPFGLTLLLNILSGEHYPIRWATPYFSLIGIIIMGYLQPSCVGQGPNLWGCTTKFLITLICFSTSLWFIRIATMIYLPRVQSDAYLPNQEIAAKLATLWHEPTPLPYLAGSPYLVSNLIPYMKNRPIPFLSVSTQESPWVKLKDLKKRGGLFVWDVGQNYTWDTSSQNMITIPKDIMVQFPRLQLLGVYTFYRYLPQKIPVKIAIARLQPQ